MTVVKFELDAEVQASGVMSRCGKQSQGVKDLPAVSFSQSVLLVNCEKFDTVVNKQ